MKESRSEKQPQGSHTKTRVDPDTGVLAKACSVIPWAAVTVGTKMSSFYRASVEEFLAQNEEQVLARLGTAYAHRGYTSQYTDQTLTWQRDISLLRQSLEQCVTKSDSTRSWGLLLEFS